jgi:hypothetical protein
MYLKRLNICRKLYGGNIRKVGKICIWKDSDGGLRRYFNFFYYNDGPARKRLVIYAVYKIEKKFGHMLEDGLEVHHKDKNTLNDKYSNLEVKTSSKHIRDHMIGNKIWLGRRHSKETKRKLSLAKMGNKNGMFGKYLSKEAKQKMRDTLIKNRIIKKIVEETRC